MPNSSQIIPLGNSTEATVNVLAVIALLQTPQYLSPAGVVYTSLRDTGGVARAESLLAAEPGTIDRVIALGVAHSAIRQYRQAIRVFTTGLSMAPNNALLYRWRGHRYISVRELDSALADLTRGIRLDSTSYDIWYHLGVARFARGEFPAAAAAFANAQRLAPNDNEIAGATDWLWMSLSRAGRAADAQAALARAHDSLQITTATTYAQRLKLYKGKIGPDQVLTPADTGDVAIATLAYGVGNWFLVKGDRAAARTWFERAVRSGGWPAFGFIVAEAELRRLK
jgi:tetratricopeptide (TPR) repeat protein